MSAAPLLDRLQRVRQTGPDRWLASCPAHEDRSPSLSVRELDDGRVLVHDFGGCGLDDVLAALGFALADLYPERLPGHSYPASHSSIPARDLLAIIGAEATVVAIVGADMLANKTISEADLQRLAQAVHRIGRAVDHARR
jgi:hypothetical protein